MREFHDEAWRARARRRCLLALTACAGMFLALVAVVVGFAIVGEAPVPLLAVDELRTTTLSAASSRAAPKSSEGRVLLPQRAAARHRPTAGQSTDDTYVTDGESPSSQPSAPVLSVTSVDSSARQDAPLQRGGEPDARWFNGRPIRPARTLVMTVTAYSPDERSCGESADGITASGYSVWTNGMKLVAADTRILPFGALVSVPGYDGGAIVPVLDRGGAIKGNRLDVLHATHELAERWGVQTLEVTVWEYADGLPSDFRESHRVAAR